jgi:hypothetical protein
VRDHLGDSIHLIKHLLHSIYYIFYILYSIILYYIISAKLYQLQRWKLSRVFTFGEYFLFIDSAAHWGPRFRNHFSQTIWLLGRVISPSQGRYLNAAHWGPRFRNHFSQTVRLLGRVISPSQGRYLNAGQHKHRINAYTRQTSMPRMEFDPRSQRPSERWQFMSYSATIKH